MAKRYVNGYLPKIEYWQGKLNEAVASFDEVGVEKASQKLIYFVGKQNSTYGGPLKGDDFLLSIGFIK
jgi:sulfur relay (sulfurtransferase) DsrC/TusE family protein